jgi:hypothetical protein
VKIKYIIVDAGFGTEAPVLFSELLKHSEVANGRKVYGAGFVQIHAEEKDGEQVLVATCYGESTSLDIKSRPEEDSKIVTSQLFSRY